LPDVELELLVEEGVDSPRRPKSSLSSLDVELVLDEIATEEVLSGWLARALQ
jgi:hypothetical protein